MGLPRVVAGTFKNKGSSSTSKPEIVKVQANGKAPSGLSVGDSVVTAGGTYKITGVKPDGSYTSEKTNDYNGSSNNYTNSNTSNETYSGGSSSSNYSPYSSGTTTTTTQSGTPYKIGSVAGQNIANNMSVGTSWTNPNDGSVWTKNKDGSVSVNHNGYYTPNAYQSPVQNAQFNIEEYLDKWMKENQKPVEEESPYKEQIDNYLSQILNRDDFSYDVANDPLYQQYAQMYQREGDRAMRETMAEAAASAGGMNSYAITAAQQANNYYNSQLNDKIPQLYQLAYEMYLNNKESDIQNLGILQQMDETQYNRYRNTLNDWYNDKNFAYGLYNDALSQGNWQTQFDYNSAIDERDYNNSEYWKNKEWNYNDYWKNKEWNAQEQAQAKEDVWNYIQLGITPSADLIAKAGMSQTDVENAVAQVKAEQIAKTRKSTNPEIEVNEPINNENYGFINGNELISSLVPSGDAEIGVALGVENLGIGPVNDETLLKLIEKGAVIKNKNGSLSWADGWGKHNYQKALAIDFSKYPTL